MMSSLCVWRVRERFLILFPCGNGYKFLIPVESKTSQFEIAVKSLARFNTQFRVEEGFKIFFPTKVIEHLAINHGTVWQQK